MGSLGLFTLLSHRLLWFASGPPWGTSPALYPGLESAMSSLCRLPRGLGRKVQISVFNQISWCSHRCLYYLGHFGGSVSQPNTLPNSSVSTERVERRQAGAHRRFIVLLGPLTGLGSKMSWSMGVGVGLGTGAHLGHKSEDHS